MARGTRKSLVGEKFGKLEVISYSGTDKFRNSLWECKCTCGRVVVVRGTYLTKGQKGLGRVVSCGVCSTKYDINLEPLEEEENTDLINKRFGNLVINKIFTREDKKGHNIKYAECNCDCGNVKTILLSNIKRGAVLSCGCLKDEKRKGNLFNLKDDLIGKKFGRLLVDSYDTDEKKWKCICDCGNITYVKGGSLRSGNTKSCGCLRKDTIKNVKRRK